MRGSGRPVGLIVFQCGFRSWKLEHAIHHATAGDLDRRGVGDVDTITVAEYEVQAVVGGGLAYRVFRNPLVMFGIGPFVAMLIVPRIPEKGARPRIRHAVWATNAAVIVARRRGVLADRLAPVPGNPDPGAAVLRRGRSLAVLCPASVRGHLLGRAEHWSWPRLPAGQLLLELPAVLQCFTGNIGFHHVHHLNARIPNYNLQRAHDENPIFHDVPVLSLVDGLRAIRLKLYDEDQGRMVTWAQARRSGGPAGGPGRAAQAPPLRS